MGVRKPHTQVSWWEQPRKSTTPPRRRHGSGRLGVSGRMTGTWSEGVCGDGAVILRDGQPVPITDVLAALNDGKAARNADLNLAVMHANDVADVALSHGQLLEDRIARAIVILDGAPDLVGVKVSRLEAAAIQAANLHARTVLAEGSEPQEVRGANRAAPDAAMERGA